MRIAILLGLSAAAALAQDAGQKVFETTCGRCHGADGRGGEMGPAILTRLASYDDGAFATLVRQGLPSRGMPPTKVTDEELAALTRFVRRLARPTGLPPAERLTAALTDGKTLEGVVVAQGFDDVQLRTADGKIRLLRRAGDKFREVTSQRDWPGYNGDPGGNRYTTLAEIDKSNVSRLMPKWIFHLAGTGRLQMTPVVVGGIMYVTAVNEIYALDAGSGREIWRFRRPKTQGSGGGANRGVAVAGDRVFFQTDHAHMLALNRFNGEVLWDAEMADYRQSYFGTSAPLVAGNLVVGGVGGGEHGTRGFLAAYDIATGKEAWRFWTVPKAGEPGAETWQGKGIERPGAPTWFTGTYDPALDVVYWPTGNPAAEYYGDDRLGDNLYSDCILALDAKTGKLNWYFQFTPHDLWDWDATETPVLADAAWEGRPRKLLLHGNRNGFFYVFDRTDGKLLLAKQFIRQLTWAKGIDEKGRPIRVPGQEPSPQGTRVCPSQDGATNWFSPSFNPQTGLFYMQTFEKCSIYTKAEPGEWTPGRVYLGGTQRRTSEKAERILRALDIRTGKVVWELPQPGPGESWGGTLATSTGLVIFAEEGGALMAADATTGKLLWSFPTNTLWKASPMTYQFDGRQYIAIASGANVIAFGLP